MRIYRGLKYTAVEEYKGYTIERAEFTEFPSGDKREVFLITKGDATYDEALDIEEARRILDRVKYLD